MNLTHLFYVLFSLLIHEWEYLKEDNGGLDIPIPDRVWKFLPRRIDEKIITVIFYYESSVGGLAFVFHLGYSLSVWSVVSGAF